MDLEPSYALIFSQLETVSVLRVILVQNFNKVESRFL